MLSRRVLLVMVPFGDRQHQPLGVAYVAGALLGAGHDVRLLAPSRLRSLDEATVATAVRDVDLVGFSSTTPAFPETLRFAAAVKAARPGLPVVLGGYHGTALHRQVLERHQEFDAVVRGEGEETAVELVAAWAGGSPPDRAIAGVTHRRGEELSVGPGRPRLTNLTRLPRPARDLLPPPAEFARYYDPVSRRSKVEANIGSSRGCPYHCSFCSIVSFYGESRIRFRDPADVVAEIAELARGSGIESVWFSDDNFLAAPRRALAIFRGVKECGGDIVFRAATRADQLLRAQGMLCELKALGLRQVELGIENGSQSALDRHAKGARVEDNAAAIALLRRLDIQVRLDFILFDPLTTIAELDENLRFLKANLGPGHRTHTAIYRWLHLYHGTEAHARAVAAGLAVAGGEREPGMLFRDPDAAEVSAFIEACQDRVDASLESAESHAVEVMEALDGSLWRGDGVVRQRLLGELLFAHYPLNRLTLRLFEDVLELKKRSPGKPVLAEDLRKLADDYVRRVEHYGGELDALHRRTVVERGGDFAPTT